MGQMRASVSKVTPYMSDRVATDGNQTLASAAAGNLQQSAIQHQARNSDVRDFGSPHAGSIEKLQYRPVAQTERIGAVNRFHQTFHLGYGEELWQLAFQFGGIEIRSRIDRGLAARVQKGMKSFYGRNVAGDGCRAQASLAQRVKQL